MRRPQNMKYLHLIEVGVWELGQMALKGELSPDKVWVSLKGAAEYFRSVADGDVAFEPVQQERLEKCQACKLSTTTKGTSAPGSSRWCGPKFKDQGPGKPCGCLVGMTVEGVEYPAGKAVVGSERCPLDKWPM